jgi:hypothetical protein
MGADFPAAHSMDTEWFAVDRDGHVALFSTGEAGSMPLAAGAGGEGAVDDMLRALGSKQTQEGLDYDEAAVGRELARLGLHVYQDASDFFSGPYRRAHKPKKPLHVDQLPPELRDDVKAMRFDGLSFAEKKVLQPCQYTDGVAWSSAYVAEDGKTVRPIPGHEKEYRKEVAEMLEEDPEELERYRFEGLEEEKPKPPKRRHKGGPNK